MGLLFHVDPRDPDSADLWWGLCFLEILISNLGHALRARLKVSIQWGLRNPVRSQDPQAGLVTRRASDFSPADAGPLPRLAKPRPCCLWTGLLSPSDLTPVKGVKIAEPGESSRCVLPLRAEVSVLPFLPPGCLSPLLLAKGCSSVLKT